ncbi:hypothetical protein ACWEPN_07810 [Nonomuraea wenchangensis]
MALNIVHIAAASMAPRRLYGMTFPSIQNGERMRTDHQRMDGQAPHIVIDSYIPAIAGIAISGILREQQNSKAK